MKEAKKHLHVMSDFTALFWDDNYVCIGEAGDDLNEHFEGFKMSEKLKNDFYNWHYEFEKYADMKPCPIDWKQYNLLGLELTKRLQEELGNATKVVYRASYRSEPYFNLTKESIVVTFLRVDLGLLEFKIEAGHQTFESRFSSVWDPLPNFLRWLEALAIGVQQSSFSYDPEGTNITFDIHWWSKDSDVLSIAEEESIYDSSEYEREVYIFCKVNRKQLIGELYWGMRKFTTSEEFKKNKWEDNYIEMGHSESSKISAFKSELIENFLTR